MSQQTGFSLTPLGRANRSPFRRSPVAEVVTPADTPAAHSNASAPPYLKLETSGTTPPAHSGSSPLSTTGLPAHILVHVIHPALAKVNLLIDLRFRWEDLFTQPLGSASTLEFVSNWRETIVLPGLLTKLQQLYDSYDVPSEESEAFETQLFDQAAASRDFNLSVVNYLESTHPSFFPGSGQHGIPFQLAAQINSSNSIAICDLPITGKAGRALMKIYNSHCISSPSASQSIRSQTSTFRDEAA